MSFTFNPFTGNLDAVSVEDLSPYVKRDGSTTIYGPQEFEKWLQATGLIVSISLSIDFPGYYDCIGSDTTFLSDLSIGDKMYDSSGNIIGTVYSLITDTHIILTEPLVSSHTGLWYLRSLTTIDGGEITSGLDNFSNSYSTFSSQEISIQNSSAEVVITPTTITGSPTILMDANEQDTDVIEIFDSSTYGTFAGTARTDIFSPDTRLFGDGTNWLADLSVGQLVYLNSLSPPLINQPVRVTSITSNTEMTTTWLFTSYAENITIDGYSSEGFKINSSGQLESNFRPEYDSTYDLGTSDLRWKEVYADSWNGNDEEDYLLIDGSRAADLITFNNSYTVTGSETTGMTYWDSDNETLSTVLPDGVIGQHFQENFIMIKNQTGSTLSNGKVAMFSGSVGASGRLLADYYLADGTYPPEHCMGIITQDIINGDDGRVTWFGKVRGITTDGSDYGETWNDGDLLYASPTTAGALTNIEPQAPNRRVLVAAVVHAHATTGTIMVRPTFTPKLTELDDVNGTTPSETNKYLIWDSNNNYWNPGPNPSESVTAEPTGFPNLTDSVMSFDDGTRTFTIEPTSTSFDIYQSGVKTTFSSAQNVTITDTEGLWFFYFNESGTLISSQTPWTFGSNLVFVAIGYWDATNNSLISGLGEERHGLMPWQVHEYLHNTTGTRYASGMTPSVTVDGDGSLNAHAEIQSISAGVMYDEDLKIQPAQQTTYEMWYKDGASGYWRKESASAAAVAITTTRPDYNEWTGATWQRTEVTNNKFTLTHVFATNRQTSNNKYILIMGENEYNSRADAQDGALTEITSLTTGDLPTVEFVPVATLIVECKDVYTNSYNARLVSTDEGYDFVDFRTNDKIGTGASTNHHGNLSGLAEDDHNQYLLADGTRELTGDWTTGSYDIIAENIGLGGSVPSTGVLEYSVSPLSNDTVIQVDTDSQYNAIGMNYDLELNSSADDVGTRFIRSAQGTVNTQKDRSGSTFLEGIALKIGQNSIAQTQGTRELRGVVAETYPNQTTGGTQEVRGVCVTPGGMVAISGSGDINNSGVCVQRNTAIINLGSGTFNSYGLKISNYTPGAYDDECYAIKVDDGNVYFPDNITDGTYSWTVSDVNTVIGYVDQDVTSGSSPTFDGANITGVDADNVDIADAGGYYTGTDVETALQEVGADVSSLLAEPHAWDVPILNPNGAYDNDTQIPVVYTTAAITVTKIVVSNNTSSYEVAGDLKWADDLISFTNATVINDFDTTSGVRSDDSITSANVAAGKYVYLQFDSQPNSAITFTHVHIEWEYQ